MSFKDVRDLGEQLKLLGYPHLFPLQALATKNGSLAAFFVVADILQWLASLLEPGTVLPGSVQSEEERILLIRSATEFFVTKSAIKLNPRKLYAATAVTASELQKITRLLITPTDKDQDNDEEDPNYRSLNQIDIGDKAADLRRARDLSMDLTQRGNALYDLLAKELINKEARIAQANRPMELASVERTMKNAISAAQLKLQSSRAQLESGRVELNALSAKLQRKRGELERTKQRLEALLNIRPAHMEEFKECEEEMEEIFQAYFQRLHCRDALRARLEARTKRVSPNASPIPQMTSESSSMPFIPEGLIDDDDADFDDELQLNGDSDSKFGFDAEILDIRDEDLLLNEYGKPNAAPMSGKRISSTQSRVRPTTGRSRKPPNDLRSNISERLTRRTTPAGGALTKRDVDGKDDDSTFGSSDSDLDMGGLMGAGGAMGSGDLLGIADDDDDDFDLNSIDDISISKITGEPTLRPKTANKQEHQSDEDF